MKNHYRFYVCEILFPHHNLDNDSFEQTSSDEKKSIYSICGEDIDCPKSYGCEKGFNDVPKGLGRCVPMGKMLRIR